MPFPPSFSSCPSYTLPFFFFFLHLVFPYFCTSFISSFLSFLSSLILWSVHPSFLSYTWPFISFLVSLFLQAWSHVWCCSQQKFTRRSSSHRSAAYRTSGSYSIYLFILLYCLLFRSRTFFFLFLFFCFSFPSSSTRLLFHCAPTYLVRF